MANVIAVTDANFADVMLNSAKPVFVDFWADWCGPCKQIAPIIDELAAQYGDSMTFVKMDTSSNLQIPAQLGVMALPTLQIYQGGQLVEQIQGAKPKAALVKLVEKYV